MAIYNKKQYTNNSSNLIILTPKSKDKDMRDIDACFEVRRRNEETGKFETTEETVSKVDGSLKSVSVEYQEFKDNVFPKVKIILDDNSSDESYLLDLKFNVLNRTLLNCLLSAASTDNLTISLYRSKKSGYNSVYVEQGGSSLRWKYSIAELPKPIDITHPTTQKVLSRDYTELDEFFVENLISWAKELGVYKDKKNDSNESASSEQPVKQEKSLKETANEVPSSNEGEDDEFWK